MTTTEQGRRSYKYYDFVMAAFVAVLICSNLIGVTKVTQVGGFAFSCGNLFFPISYLFGDILTEVYGYARSRRVVWTGFSALAFMSFMSFVVVHMPPADGWKGQETIEAAFGSTWRISLSSLIAYFCGEFANSYTLAKLKIRMEGKRLWMRFVASTVVGEAVDSLLFYPLAFMGSWDNELLLRVLMTNYCIKVGWEILATPLTYKVVNFLKKAEGEDYYDVNTKFTPFSLRD